VSVRTIREVLEEGAHPEQLVGLILRSGDGPRGYNPRLDGDSLHLDGEDGRKHQVALDEVVDIVFITITYDAVST
jgi:hypothetical protein